VSFVQELRRRNVFRVALFYIVSSWLVVQVAETLLPIFDVPDGVLRAIVFILALGFLPAVIFAWAFELTPDGLKRDSNARVDPRTKQKTARKLNLATLAVAVLAIGLLIADRLMPEHPSKSDVQAAAGVDEPPAEPRLDDVSPDAASIAVLPFADLSPEGDQQYFSDGIAEEILNVLVGVEGLAVASRTSSFQFKAIEGVGMPAIAGQLNVRHVLEGSVRSSGNTIRVTAQLIDAHSDQHLWSDTWDRELTADNLFAIQDEIATAIVRSIRDNLGVDVGMAEAVPQRTSSVDAYSLFLRSRALFRSRTFFAEAHELIVRAIELDPEFTDALALRAAILVVSPEYGVLLEASPEQSRVRARKLAELALETDPDHALALGVIGLAQDFDLFAGRTSIAYADILASYDAALRSAPDDLAVLNWRGFSYLRAGDIERAKDDFKHCMRVEPAYAPCSSNLMAALTLSGRTDEALDVMDRAIRLGVLTGDVPSLVNLHQLGLEREFYMHAIRLPSLRGWLGREEIYRALSHPEKDHGLLIQRLEAHGDNVGTRASINELLVALGEYQYPPPTYAIWFDAYRAYRASPEFERHVRELGLLDYWREHGFPPKCRPLGEDDFECD
jgi:TolB-like protein/tetratricopeptide (TPR) repeat protein